MASRDCLVNFRNNQGEYFDCAVVEQQDIFCFIQGSPHAVGERINKLNTGGL